MNFGLIIIGDEILSGKRADKHLAQAISMLGARGLQVAYAHYVGDDPQRITATLSAAFASGDVVFLLAALVPRLTTTPASAQPVRWVASWCSTRKPAT